MKGDRWWSISGSSKERRVPSFRRSSLGRKSSPYLKEKRERLDLLEKLLKFLDRTGSLPTISFS